MTNNKMDLKPKQNTHVQKVSANTSSENGSWFSNCASGMWPNINKPLLPLKIILFCWYGTGTMIQMFIPVYFKQIGLSVSQQSIIYMATPPFLLLGPVVSGFIADKTGRPKIVLQVNIILTLIFANAMLLLPNIGQSRCPLSSCEINCSSTVAVVNMNESFQTVDLSTQALELKCSDHCTSQQLSNHKCNVSELPMVISTTNFSKADPKFFLTCMRQNESYILEDMIVSLNSSWCETNPLYNVTCFSHDCKHCAENIKNEFTYFYIFCFILLVFFQCTLSICYGFMDVAAMVMVKAYNSDLGRERLWTVFSILLLSPLAGYLVKITSTTGCSTNYASAFYFFDAMAVVTLITIIKLDVEINAPGKNMWEKTLCLLNKPDVLVFSIALLILGTSWAFHQYFSFLYLDELNAPSVLLGLLPAISSLAALPFLLTSNWWVQKFGSTNMLILGLVSYSVHGSGYSFLITPWYALICEVLGIFNYHLLWIAVVHHAHKIAPEGLTASVISTASGLHFGIGRGTGSCVGLIMGNYGGRIAYRFVAVMCATAAFCYTVYVFVRSRRRVKTQALKGEKNAQNDSERTEIVSPTSKEHYFSFSSSEISNPS